MELLEVLKHQSEKIAMSLNLSSLLFCGSDFQLEKCTFLVKQTTLRNRG